MTMDAWFEYWFENIISPNVKYQTRRWYKGRYDKRIKPVIGTMMISEVKPIHCQQVMNYLNSKEDSTGSKKKIKSFMSSLFAAAIENELIASNPVTRSVRYVNKEPKERRVLTVDEQKVFSEKAKMSKYYDEYMFDLETGLRVGEISGLKWSDVDWHNRTITITETMYYNNDTHEFVTDKPKTQAGNRTIRLTERAYRILLGRKNWKTDKPIPIKWHRYIFLNQNGNPVDSRTYNKCLKRIIKGMCITDPFSMHCLRHTFATRCIEADMRPKTLQYILGHSRLSMTMDLYVRVTRDDVTEEMEQFEVASRKWA